jgi:GT2 family glycosyltransferase
MAAGQEGGRRATVSAVIITRNRRAALEIVLDRLASLPVDEIVVVDNGSDDGTHELLDARRGSIVLVDGGGNSGVAGRNRGAEHSSGAFLLHLDDDAYPLPGAIEAMLDAFARDPRLGVAGGFVRDIDTDGTVVAATGLGSFDWWLRGGQEGDPPEGLPAIFFPEGACMFRREAFIDAGGFFEPYFLYCSEIDLATRLLQRGWDVRYCTAAAFDHMKAGGNRDPYTVYHLRIRNQLWYFWLRMPVPVAAIRTAGYLGFDLVDATAAGVPSAWGHAIRDAWRGRRDVAPYRSPLTRAVRRRAERNRGRMHVRLLAGQLRRRLDRLGRHAGSSRA